MTDRPTPDDLANKSERDLAYAWECADRLAEALEMIALTKRSTFNSSSIMARTHQLWASDALAAYREKRR